VEAAFEAVASESRLLEKAASFLDNKIQAAWRESPEISWPPRVSDVLTSNISKPKVLQNFLCVAVSGCRSSHNAHTERLCSSTAADICVASTQGKWALPKHILLGMSLQHLTGSATVITMINRYGHCQSYSKLLEVETAIANSVEAADDILPANISLSGNIVSHLCWDNFAVNEETRSGAETAL